MRKSGMLVFAVLLALILNEKGIAAEEKGVTVENGKIVCHKYGQHPHPTAKVGVVNCVWFLPTRSLKDKQLGPDQVICPPHAVRWDRDKGGCMDEKGERAFWPEDQMHKMYGLDQQ